MKIIYLHQYFKFPNETGGTRSYDLATSFVKNGHSVSVVTATSDKKYYGRERWSVIEKDGLKINYIYLPYGNNLSYIQRSLVFFKFLWFSSFRLLKLKADVVLATSTPLTIGVPALIKKWLGKTPFIFEVRDVWPEAVIAIGAIKNKFLQKVLYRLEKVLYKNATYIVPLSTDMRKSIVTRYPQFTNKAGIVIENIAEVNRFQKNDKSINLEEIVGFKPRFSVLYAGTFGRVNGINKLVELAEKTLKLDKTLIFILIGTGAEKENIIKMASDKGVLGKNVFILDSIPKNQLPLWYNSVSMGASFVIDIPELWANSANKFFDTLAAAKPILINHEGWQSKVIEEHNIGYVLPYNIDEQSAKCFVVYSNNVGLIKEQSIDSLILAKKKYSLEKATENYLKVLRKINL